MTEPQQPGWGDQQQPMNKKDAKAQAAAAKAYSKSQRSWFARHKILTGLGALILLGIIISATSGGGDSGGDTTTAGSDSSSSNSDSGSSGDADDAEDAEDDAPAASTGIGQAARDGKFEFTVTSVEPGPAMIGSEGFGQKPQGQFLFVRVKVENVGNEPQTFFGDNQFLYAGERKFSADTEAAIYLDDASSLFEEINPGNSLEGIIVFDVPPGTTPTKLELHDSAFSGGVDVNL